GINGLPSTLSADAASRFEMRSRACGGDRAAACAGGGLRLPVSSWGAARPMAFDQQHQLAPPLHAGKKDSFFDEEDEPLPSPSNSLSDVDIDQLLSELAGMDGGPTPEARSGEAKVEEDGWGGERGGDGFDD
ncbi:unnamed protein product, partial [Ectocarpus sp. 4 AP-2014]